MWVWWTFLLANLGKVRWNCEAWWVVVWKCEGVKWCKPWARIFVRGEKYQLGVLLGQQGQRVCGKEEEFACGGGPEWELCCVLAFYTRSKWIYLELCKASVQGWILPSYHGVMQLHFLLLFFQSCPPQACFLWSKLPSLKICQCLVIMLRRSPMGNSSD